MPASFPIRPMKRIGGRIRQTDLPRQTAARRVRRSGTSRALPNRRRERFSRRRRVRSNRFHARPSRRPAGPMLRRMRLNPSPARCPLVRTRLRRSTQPGAVPSSLVSTAAASARPKAPTPRTARPAVSRRRTRASPPRPAPRPRSNTIRGPRSRRLCWRGCGAKASRAARRSIPLSRQFPPPDGEVRSSDPAAGTAAVESEYEEQLGDIAEEDEKPRGWLMTIVAILIGLLVGLAVGLIVRNFVASGSDVQPALEAAATVAPPGLGV